MMRWSMTIVLVVAAAACGGDKKGEGKGGGKGGASVFPDAPAVFAAARERTDAMCACPDTACRLEVTSRINDPFGEKARAVREAFNPDQQKTWNDLVARFAECATRK